MDFMTTNTVGEPMDFIIIDKCEETKAKTRFNQTGYQYASRCSNLKYNLHTYISLTRLSSILTGLTANFMLGAWAEPLTIHSFGPYCIEIYPIFNDFLVSVFKLEPSNCVAQINILPLPATLVRTRCVTEVNISSWTPVGKWPDNMEFNPLYPIWFARTERAVNSVFLDYAFTALMDDNEIDILDHVLNINGQEYHLTGQTAVRIHQSKIYDSRSSPVSIWAFPLHSLRREPKQIHKFVRWLYGKAKKRQISQFDPRYTLVDNAYITVAAPENDRIPGLYFYLISAGWSALN